MGDLGPASSPGATQLAENETLSAPPSQDIHVLVTGFGVCGNPHPTSSRNTFPFLVIPAKFMKLLLDKGFDLKMTC